MLMRSEEPEVLVQPERAEYEAEAMDVVLKGLRL